ncbi:unnamed protein product [Cochlearia groenlandica]
MIRVEMSFISRDSRGSEVVGLSSWIHLSLRVLLQGRQTVVSPSLPASRVCRGTRYRVYLVNRSIGSVDGLCHVDGQGSGVSS